MRRILWSIASGSAIPKALKKVKTSPESDIGEPGMTSSHVSAKDR
ncbi:hypothetical protein WNY39_12580 [Sulfitobacter sp. AS59]